MKRVDRLMRQAVEDRIFPGGVLLVSRDDRIVFFEAYGRADLFSGEPATRETIYDLASLTKPLATTLAVMKLVQESRLSLDQQVVSVLPGFQGPLMDRVTIRQLLSHSSGLADYRPYYLSLRHFPAKERKERLETLLTRERLFFIELDQQARLDHFAATELCDWRNILLKGKVHDDNAFVMGGIDGHAGLFGSAADVARLISVLLSDFRGRSGRSFFNFGLVREFWSRQSPSGRALGFDMPSLDGASCGQYFSKTGVGHLGFTGTSVWIDPEQSIFIVLLTNRIHPSRYNVGIRRFRPLIHDAIMGTYINL